MYSQANVRAGKVLRSPIRMLPSVIVDTEKVLREADGPMKRAIPMPAMRDGLKGVRSLVRLKNRTVRAGEEPEEHRRYKEFLEIVGNGSPTAVLEETIAVSATISISVEKLHHQIRLRILSCSRLKEMRREPEVPEERVPVVECLDGPARITLKELAPIHSVKSGTLENACSTSLRVDADLGKSALMRIARLMNNLEKGLKRMMTKVQ